VTPSRPLPQPEDEMARTVSRAAELLEVLWGRASTAPVSASQLRALLVLEHNEGINLRTLADALGSSPPSISRLCDRLEAMGLVDRSPSTASRRELELHLSSRGRTYLAELRARRERELQAVLARMPTAKRQALVQGLDAFCQVAAAEVQGEAGDARTA
jgi:DNA-binding MarR family transcriptional regulator